MEFTNEIFFNKPLIAGNTVIIRYCGQLYREHSKDVSIVFGYGDNWDETDNSPMIETENGFEVTLTIKNYNTFNFCFNNSFNIWDNNSGFNYIAPISQEQETSISEEDENENNDQDQDNDNTPDIDENIDNNDDNAEKEIPYFSTYTEEEDTLTEENQDENNEDEDNNDDVANIEIENEKSAEDIETIFSSLLDSILDGTNSENETIDIDSLSGFGLQSIDEEIKEEDMINCDAIFAELFNELTEGKNETSSIQAESIEKTEEIEENVENIEVENINYDKYNVQELDSLMDNLLMSIAQDTTVTEEATPIEKVEEISEDLSDENVGLLAPIESEDWVDKIINISYNLTKKFTTACKKLGCLIKIKAKEFGFIGNNK